MFDDLDIEKLEAEDAKRQEVKKQFEQHGPDEVYLAQMRDGFLSKTNEKNARNLERIEESSEEFGSKSVISDEVEKFSEEENTTDKVSDNTESVNEEIENKEEKDEHVDVESETVSQPTNAWEKEKEELTSLMKQKDELLIKMYNEIQNFSKPQEVSETKPKEEISEGISEEEIVNQAKEIIKNISYAEEDNASEKLAKLLLGLAKNNKKQDISEEKIEELLSKREQKKYVEKFEKVKQDFLNSEEGKKITSDEDLLDLYQAKFVRLQNSGKHLNPEDLFKEAYNSTMRVVGGNKASSSTAKPVPKVSDSLKDDVSKAEETKRQAVKPSSSSNAGKPAASKKFNQVDAYKEYLKSIGQTI